MQRASAAFTLIEIMVTVGIVGVVFVALCQAIGTNLRLVRLCRENQDTTQILTEKFEAIRLYAWDQITSNNFVPATFTVPVDPGNSNSAPYYTGTVTIAAAPVSESYSNELRLITVRLDWTSGARPCSRSMSSFVTRYGLQNYVY
jgi:prepilin-type N-terminal cleavage/methylation domain-containing protein